MEAENKTSSEAPKITKAEVVKWENDFREKVSPLVKFDTQDNGYSMKFYNGESGVDAYWSGTIVLKADNYLKWNFSMLNGVFMESKMNLDENNQRIPSNLYDFFRGWQGEVAKAITEPVADQQQGGAIAAPEQTPDLAGPESANAPQAPEEDAGALPLAEGSLISNKPITKNNTSRVDNSRKNNIMDSVERMRRLAGL
jgi:hypothetical protein